LTTSTFTPLGAVVAGEIPEPYEESWDTADGDNLTLSGFTCEAKWKVDGGTQVTRAGSVNTSTSTTTVVWQAADHAAAGLMAGEVAVTDGTNTYKRSFQRVILPARGGA
jgi:hypothetical protein